MINIDPYLDIIDNDEQIQKKLQLLADDVFNNNEFLLRMHPEENACYSELVNSVGVIVERHRNAFLNEDAQSATLRINYKHLCAISRDRSKEYFARKLASNLVACLASEKQKHNNDYIEQLLNTDTDFLPPGLNLAVSKDGLVDISESPSKIKLLDHAIDMLDGRRIYLHQFLRRHFNSNFVDTPRILNFAIQRGLKVEVRIDPFRIGDMSRYHNIIECDAWFGPKFNQRLLDSKDKAEKVTIHHFNGDNPREKAYNQYVTIFRTSMLDTDKGLRQFFIEEYPPYLDWVQSPMSGVEEKYVLQRFAHFVYNQNSDSFEHIDCAVRVFTREEYDKIHKMVNQNNDPGRGIGKRFKLFKISGRVDSALLEQSSYFFFRGNVHLVEYFHDLDFSGAIEWFERKQTERAALTRKYNKYCPY